MLQVSELYIYPIKSLPGIALTKAMVTDRGFEHDRRWMLVDENNRFISQREFAQMTQLKVAIENDNLVIRHKFKNQHFSIPLNPPAAAEWTAVTIWDDTCDAQFVSNEADVWFSDMLGINCRLVYMPNQSKRQVDERYAPKDNVTSFSDAYPFLMIGQASLNDLNNRLIEAVPIDRFRPNIVFTGGEPFEEDLIAHFKIGDLNFYGVKLCARCVVITINQENGTKAKEPTKTLASYRSKNKKIYFGQNLIHTGEGAVSIGDKLNIISSNNDERFFISHNVL